MVGLDDRAARALAASGPADDLREQAVRPLGGVVVLRRRAKGPRPARRRASRFQNPAPWRPSACQEGWGFSFLRNSRSSASCPRDAPTVSASIRSTFASGNSVVQLLLDLLRAGADALHQSRRTRCTVSHARLQSGRSNGTSAVRWRNGTSSARCTAGTAARQPHSPHSSIRAAAAPVEKQNALLAAFEIFLKLCAQRVADRGLVPLPQLVLHVGDEHLGQRQIVEPLMKGKDLIASVFGGVCRFNRRRGRAEAAAARRSARSGTARRRARGSAADFRTDNSSPAPHPK